jgi:hypothetical protein
MTCERCGAETLGHSMSWFTTEDLCDACKTEEREAPNYNRARAAEESAVRAGMYNFAGIGLAPEDAAALAAARARRRS